MPCADATRILSRAGGVNQGKAHRQDAGVPIGLTAGMEASFGGRITPPGQPSPTAPSPQIQIAETLQAVHRVAQTLGYYLKTA